MEDPKVWGPDTCTCRVYKAVDRDTGVERFVSHAEAIALHVLAHIARPSSTKNPAERPLPPVRLCPAHASAGDSQEWYNTLHAECRRKNVTMSIAQSVKGTLTAEDYRWSFDANRVLLVSFTISVTTNQKASIQSACDTQFGAGKVVVS